MAAPVGTRAGSVLQYQVDTGSHYFGLLSMAARRDRPGWTLQVGPRGATVVRDD